MCTGEFAVMGLNSANRWEGFVHTHTHTHAHTYTYFTPTYLNVSYTLS